MSGSNKTTSAEDFICESNGLSVKQEMETSSRDEFGDEFIQDNFLAEMPFVYYETEIEIKHEDVDYNSTPDLDSETGYDLAFETISKTRAHFSSSAIHIQSGVDEGIVKMECSEEEEERNSDSPSVQTRQIEMSGSNRTSPENINSESSEMNIKVEMSPRDESGEEFIPVIRLSEAPLFIHDTEIEIKYEEVDYNNTPTPALDSEAEHDLDFETISKTRAELYATAVLIQSEVDESIVKMECSEEDEEGKSDSESESSGSESDPDYCPTSRPNRLARDTHRQSLPKNHASNDSTRLKSQKRRNHMKGNERGKSLTTKAHLTIHVRTHTGERPYTCEQCMHSFSSKGSLTVHKRIHTGEKPYQCTVCEKQFAQLTSLTVHKSIHTGEKPYECSVCEMSFTGLTDLTRHTRIHTGERSYRCDECGNSFFRKSTLIIHMRLHTGEKPFKCDICCKSFTTLSNLNVHTRVHTGERPYKCNSCEKSFSHKTTLTTHMRIHTT